MLTRIARGRTALVFDAIADGLPATAADENGVTLIRWCAYHGDVSAIRFLLDHGESLAALPATSLNEASFHGHWRLCELLVRPIGRDGFVRRSPLES